MHRSANLNPRLSVEGGWRNNRCYRKLTCKFYFSDKWISKFVVGLVLTILLIILLYIFQPFQTEVNIIVIDAKRPLLIVDKHFLSIALDSSLIADNFQGFDPTDYRIIALMHPFRGGYLRIGGTMADRLIFNSSEDHNIKIINSFLDNGECSYDGKFCNVLKQNFNMSGKQWTQLNDLANKTGQTVLFDLNCLLRHANGTWDSANAEKLIKFSDENKYDLIWELGNEPNSFKHVFDVELNATQLAYDFKHLQMVLKKYPRYERSLIVGPDITRPRSKQVIDYLKEFLIHQQIRLNAITWHQYYFNGRDAYLYYFVNPEIFDLLKSEILLVKDAVKKLDMDYIPLWLGETSSAYGGGAPGFSDRYVSTFIWLDKLGLSARMGIEVVIRQSFFKGHYALISDMYVPNPDWWISVLYKRLVDEEVIKCNLVAPPEVRFYCHCTPKNRYVEGPAVTVFGMNMRNSEAIIRIQQQEYKLLEKYRIHAFIIQTHVSILSRTVYLNDELLVLKSNYELPDFVPVVSTSNMIVLPPYSLGFWIVESNHFEACIL
ncbi:PREDICTED: heparanase-like isoform X2 [Nicrophorus vespilloides]|uniref:Heparanase-like isoform X2 n=1 Tax=Nicrophorus vespilloides TaxID=110193 RepID=A0ABM1MVL5_NICVS|nr:PREDICTED: heparanase-like isoform X2 [Nicrophorus vespilloides]